MVDATPYDPTNKYFTSETMVKILLGAIDENLDASFIQSPSSNLGEILY